MLLSWAQQQSTKPISANNQSKYAQLAAEVENTVLRDLIGVALLQAIQAAPANYVLLLDGDSFKDCHNNTIRHKGLRHCLAYWNYEKYLGESFVNDTFTGFVQKTRPDSDQINEGTVRRLQKNAREIAMSEWYLIDRYLVDKQEPLYYSGLQKNRFLPKFREIKSTGSREYHDQKTRTIIR